MTTPADLRARLAEDYAPLRPLPPPAARALWITPLAALALVAAPTYFDVRVDADRLGGLLTWGVSIAQAAAGMVLIAAALRESVPGRAWRPSQLAAWTAAPVLIVAAVTYVSYGVSPMALDRGWWGVGLLCLSGSAATALPIVALANVLAARAYPTRPLLIGVLSGLGAGLMADAGWRIFCHFSEPAHVLAAHLGGVVVSAIAGAALAVTLRRPFR
jgi:hypothetical protein